MLLRFGPEEMRREEKATYIDCRLGRCENKLVGMYLMLVFCSDLEKDSFRRATDGTRVRT